MINTTYDNLPQRVGEMILDIKEIKSLLKVEAKSEPVSKTLSLDRAISFLKEQGYPVSKSRIYKLTAAGSGGLPFRRFGSRLVFDRDELLEWCRGQILISSHQDSIDAVVKSANKKYFINN